MTARRLMLGASIGLLMPAIARAAEPGPVRLGSRDGNLWTDHGIRSNAPEFRIDYRLMGADGQVVDLSTLAGGVRVREAIMGSAVVKAWTPKPIQHSVTRTYPANAVVMDRNERGRVGVSQGSVTVGFALTMMVHPADDGSVDVEYFASLSKLDQMREIQALGVTLELPEVSSRQTDGKTRVRPGREIVLGRDMAESRIVTSLTRIA